MIDLRNLLRHQKFFAAEYQDILCSREDEAFILVTQWNSFLGINKAGVLCHEPLGSSDAAAVCVSDGAVHQSSIHRPLAAKAVQIFSSEATLDDLKLIELPDSLLKVVLAAPGAYLSGNGVVAGAVKLQPEVTGVTVYELRSISSLAKAKAWNGRWVHRETRTLLEFNDLELMGPLIPREAANDIGGLVDFSRLPPEREGRQPQQAGALQGSLGPPAGDQNRASDSDEVKAFNPLIYYCIYGSYQYLEALAISLESLDRLGHFDGAIAVVTDFSEQAIRRHVPERFLGSLIVLPMPRGPTWLGRYCPDFSVFSQFQPVLYLDCDVVCARPINDLLVDVLLSDKICIATEWREYANKPAKPAEWEDYGDWFGKFLFDNAGYTGTAAFGNSGIIGVSDIRKCEDVYADMSRLMSTPGVPLALGDQPYLNFLLHIRQKGDFALIDRHIQIIRRSSGFSPGSPHTLLHVLNALSRPDKTLELRLTLSRVALQRNYIKAIPMLSSAPEREAG